MPQGKGTYGSQVGRPLKKQKKYQEGGEVPMENEAIKEANKMGQELKSIPLEGVEADFPIADARDRMETYQLGGQVKSPTTPSIKPTPQHEKGGKVDVTDVVKSAEKAKRFQVKEEESGKPIWTKKKKIHRRKAKKMAKEILEK